MRHPVNHQRVTLCGFSGGVVGGAYGTTLENCHFIGNITEGYNVGGIIGIGVESSIINCSTKGNNTGSFYVGGIAGQLYGNDNVNVSRIESCSVEGNISSIIGYSARGIVGSSINPYMRMSKCICIPAT